MTWTRGRIVRRNLQRASGTKSPLQHEMRTVSRRMIAGTARRFLDLANFREIKSLTKSCVRCSKDQRKHKEHAEEVPNPQ